MTINIIRSFILQIVLQSHLCIAAFTQGAMPKALDSFAIGYDANDGKIVLLGGDLTTRQLTLFQPDTHAFDDRGSTFLPSAHETYGIGQHYTQLHPHDELWVIHSGGTTLITMDLTTYSTSSAPTTLPSGVRQYGCLTSSDDYLIVIGSGPSTTWNTADIYHTTTNVWLSNVPLLNQQRRALPCAVVNNKAYAIGGWGKNSAALNTIEVLDISNKNIDSFTAWENFNDVLSRARFAGRAVIYGTDIYVIGGSAVQAGTALTDVGIIDTVAGQYYDITDSLSYRVTLSSSIIVGNVLFVFGGWDQTTAQTQSRYQYITLPTPSPTKAPSNEPTPSPTSAPNSPSNQPTKSPTFLPSNMPTHVPTLLPTSSPTTEPSNMPSHFPTSSPTSLPTLPPSYFPTIEPTQGEPSAATTSQPTEMEDLKEGRAHEVNNTASGETRDTPPQNNDSTLETILYVIAAIVLLKVICFFTSYWIRVLYKNKRKNSISNMANGQNMANNDAMLNNMAIHKDTIESNDVIAPGLNYGQSASDVEPPGMQKDSMSSIYDKPNTNEKKKILVTRTLLSTEIVPMEGVKTGADHEDNDKTVEGVEDVTKQSTEEEHITEDVNTVGSDV